MNLTKIELFNPWWKIKNFKVEESSFKKRFIYDYIKSDLEKTNFMISVSGLRRLGKTTILRQLIGEFLETEIKSTNIFYYKFSNIDISLKETLDYFFRSVNNFEDLYSSKYYIFLDEIQYVDNWQDIIIDYYEINKNIKFVLSGSASLYVNKNVKESLAGRIRDFNILPLSFREYIFMKYGKKIDFSLSERYISKVGLYKNDFFRYLQNGEYPETLSLGVSTSFVYFSEMIIEKIFNKDIEIFNVQKKQELYLIYKILLEQIGTFTNITTIAKDVGISKQTIKNYTEILEKAYLTKFCKNYLRGIRKENKSFPKIYSSSINLLLSTLQIKDIDNHVFPDFRGHIIENYVFNLLSTYFEDLYFYNKNNLEVDFIGIKEGKIYPIEVKYASKINPNKLSPLISYCKKNDLKEAIVFYNGEYKREDIKGVEVEFFPWSI